MVIKEYRYLCHIYHNFKNHAIIWLEYVKQTCMFHDSNCCDGAEMSATLVDHDSYDNDVC